MGLMDFFRPRWQHSDWRERRKAVSHLTDPALLTKIAETDSDHDVRNAALVKITTDQATLADIARTSFDVEVCLKAVNGIADQVVLADIAKTHHDSVVGLSALRRLTDPETPAAEQAVLAEIVNADTTPSVQEAALLKLTDQAMLAEIARTHRNIDIRRAAVARVTDAAVVAAIHIPTPEDFVIKRRVVHHF